jgi:L-fuconolactonase
LFPTLKNQEQIMTDTRTELKAWHDQVIEPILDPDREIIDSHHHLWDHPGGSPYLLDDLWADTSSGHNIVKTVFLECGSHYRQDGSEHLKPVGETEFVRAIAAQTRKATSHGHPEIAGIIGHADLRLVDVLEEVLDAHLEAGRGLFRGIRVALARAPADLPFDLPGSAPEGLAEDSDFRRGVNYLGSRGLTWESWHFHPQNREFAALARACPNTQMVLDHFGTPVMVGPYEARREEIFASWKADIAEIAKCENVAAKIGGLSTPVSGWGWVNRELPPTSDEFCELQKPFYLHAIECFGPDRCMFESNFPVDKTSLSYQVYWNGVKKIVADFSEDEKTAMFSGTATRVYRL